MVFSNRMGVPGWTWYSQSDHPCLSYLIHHLAPKLCAALRWRPLGMPMGVALCSGARPLGTRRCAGSCTMLQGPKLLVCNRLSSLIPLLLRHHACATYGFCTRIALLSSPFTC